MESGFTDFVLDRLNALADEIHAGQEPSDIALKEVIYSHLRREYDRAAAFSEHVGARS